MQWLNALVDEIMAAHPDGKLLIESGASPSGTYHFGHLREIITADALLLELRRREREVEHVHFVDDLDALRKIPVNIPKTFDQYLGRPLCDIPAPDGSDASYADFFLNGFTTSAEMLGIEMTVIRSHKKYAQGFFAPAIEKALSRLDLAKKNIESIAGRQLDEHWSPVQIMEKGYLKNRRFIRLNADSKTITYEGQDGTEHAVRYDDGKVKLDWRLDWPARWWLLSVAVEPFGRDHATKGGSFDTGVGLMKNVFEAPEPLPVPYDFVNRAGDTKKMSASKGTGIEATQVIEVLPPEVVRFFMLRFPPAKRLYFDAEAGASQLVDEFAALNAKNNKTESEEQLLYVCTRGLHERTVSRVPFSHLVASYQAALKDIDTTLAIMKRTEHHKLVEEDEAVIQTELRFIDAWLKHWAPEDVKFELIETLDSSQLSAAQKDFLTKLGQQISKAPKDADGQWFHQAIYAFKGSSDIPPKELFSTLYQVLIGKDSGPRAGWFLSILPRDWLIKRLQLKS